MQKVSKVYKESMKSFIRERGYIMLSFGLINQEGQFKATANLTGLAYYSDPKNLFNLKSTGNHYATLEKDFLQLDGKLLFPPRQGQPGMVDTGVVSNDFVSGAGYEINIDIGAKIDLKGLTLNFGANFPVSFDVVFDTEQKISVTNNNQSEWKTEEVFNGVSALKIVFKAMRNEYCRARLNSVLFGYGLIYGNDEVIESRLDSYVSPIGADVPQIDFSVKLNNRDGYFNVDNPHSAINFLETGQKMDISFGYGLPTGEIEWVKGNNLLCASWESDQETAIIRCQDVFRNLNGEFYRGKYYPDGISYFNLAEMVLDDAGVKDYYIDPRLNTLFTKNPMPRVKHKEALQIIANACRCTLSQSRSGRIQIKSFFTPKINITAEAQAPYSKISNVIKENISVIEYAAFQKNYTKLDGLMRLKDGGNLNLLETGYVSNALSNEEGLFDVNPIVKLKMDAIREYYGIKIVFGEGTPSEFILRTYKSGILVNTFNIKESEIDPATVILDYFEECNEIQLEFVKTKYPHNRITINKINLSDVANFKIEQMDILGSIKALKEESTKEIIVPYYTYQNGNKQEILIQESVSVENGQIIRYFFGSASHGYSASFNGSIGNVEILDSGGYFVELKFKISGMYQLEIKGYQYIIAEKRVIKSLSDKGRVINWKNPVMDDFKMATELANWLGEHYSSDIEYEYRIRGNPEIDATDIVYQHNDFRDDMKVNLYQYTFEFRQAFSGKVKARRVGGQN